MRTILKGILSFAVLAGGVSAFAKPVGYYCNFNRDLEVEVWINYQPNGEVGVNLVTGDSILEPAVLFYKEYAVKGEFHSSELTYALVTRAKSGYENIELRKRTLVVQSQTVKDELTGLVYPLSAKLYFGEKSDANSFVTEGACEFLIE